VAYSKKHTLFVAALSVLVAVSHAQTLPSFPSEAALEREKQKALESSADALNNPQLRMPGNSFPKLDLGSAPSVDIESIAKQYRAKVPDIKQDDLFVFASFSMPLKSLERLMSDASKVGAVVVFRGFKNNSWKETAEAIAALKNEGVNAVVNPNAFKAFKVKVVPVVVIIAPNALQNLNDDGLASAKDFASVTGDVTLDYALERIAKTNQAFAVASNRYIKALRGSI
jgi:conjugal transfer pilus assembly protein TrbC